MAYFLYAGSFLFAGLAFLMLVLRLQLSDSDRSNEANAKGRDFQHLSVGRTYRVKKAFVDHDKRTHDVGEVWTYLDHHFVPYDDGLTLVVRAEGEHGQIRLWWDEQGQAGVIDALADHVEEWPPN